MSKARSRRTVALKNEIVEFGWISKLQKIELYHIASRTKTQQEKNSMATSGYSKVYWSTSEQMNSKQQKLPPHQMCVSWI